MTQTAANGWGKVVSMDTEKKQEFLNEATHWLIITMVHDDRLRAFKGHMNECRNNQDVCDLVELGCDDEVLLNTFAFAATLEACYPDLTAADLRELAKDCRSVVWRMKQFTPSLALPFQRDDGSIDYEPTGGDMHVWPGLEEEIEKKAKCYESLAELCTEKLLPTRATLRKLAYLWPVIYVKSRTGQPHYAAVSRILQFVGVTKSGKHLEDSLDSATRQFGGLLQWMTLATAMLSETTC